MSLGGAPGGSALIVALRTHSLARLAADRGVPEEEVIQALLSCDDGGPAHAAPGWPELLRQRTSVSLRALARTFQTEPRRIRRALARAGLRAGGVELWGDGVPALFGARDRLGREPDRTLARAAGVSVEAVQGERNRLGIHAFLPGEPLRLTPEEDA